MAATSSREYREPGLMIILIFLILVVVLVSRGVTRLLAAALAHTRMAMDVCSIYTHSIIFYFYCTLCSTIYFSHSHCQLQPWVSSELKEESLREHTLMGAILVGWRGLSLRRTASSIWCFLRLNQNPHVKFPNADPYLTTVKKSSFVISINPPPKPKKVATCSHPHFPNVCLDTPISFRSRVAGGRGLSTSAEF